MSEHPWVLVGPWYRSESAGGPPANRTTAPILQKYGDAGFMDKFIREPQRSLHFTGEDFSERLCADPNRVITPAQRDALAKELAAPSDPSLKLFLHAHSRFYLVVCELHCVAPGFPSTRREQVCESGFVIRRRVPLVPPAQQPELLARQRHLARAREQLVRLREPARKRVPVRAPLVREALSAVNEKRLQSLRGELQQGSRELQDFLLARGIRAERQGWFPHPHDAALGDWRAVESGPQQIEEKIYPLYPLTPAPADKNHSARGKTLWFGLVPTGASDMDSGGNPQFDESDLYEIQCFVRRRKPCCQNTGPGCCRGEVVWSRPTEGYRLAPYFDIDGTSHKPINIKMPDLQALKAQAGMGPPGRGAGVKTIAPANSSLNFGTNGMDMPSVDGDQLTRPGQQICFFAIFLFFIVALFLFRLFLPILMFLFQLWFLLKLKFCIPPSLEIDAGLAADLEVQGPDIEAAIELDAGVLAEIGSGFDSRDHLHDTLAESLAAELASAGGGAPNAFAGDLESKLKNTVSLNELADLFIAASRDFSAEPDPGRPSGQIPAPGDGLSYFEVVPPPGKPFHRGGAPAAQAVGA